MLDVPFNSKLISCSVAVAGRETLNCTGNDIHFYYLDYNFHKSNTYHPILALKGVLNKATSGPNQFWHDFDLPPDSRKLSPFIQTPIKYFLKVESIHTNSHKLFLKQNAKHTGNSPPIAAFKL